MYLSQTAREWIGYLALLVGLLVFAVGGSAVVILGIVGAVRAVSH